jgi:hypothetical protein
MKNIISIFLTAAISLCLFTACGQTEPEITETAPETAAVATTTAPETTLTAPAETTTPTTTAETTLTTTVEIITAETENEAETKANAATSASETAPADPAGAADAYAIDKINVEPLPENSYYMTKFRKGIIILGDKWQCDINGENDKELFQSLDKYAEGSMAALVVNYKYESADLIWEDPVHTTIADYDAVLYNYTIEQTPWVTDSEGVVVTDENGVGSAYKSRHFTGRAYFFYSETDAYYIIFQCETPDYEECAPEWDQIIANVKVDEDLKIADVTTISASYVVTDY